MLDDGTVAVAANRAQVEPLHEAVLKGWRDVVVASRAHGLADRVVVSVQLEKRARALATEERLAAMTDLASQSDGFAVATKAQSPLSVVFAVIGLASTVLGFFGWWSWKTFQEVASPAMETAELGAQRTQAAVLGFLAVASGGVIAAIFRGAVRAAQSAAATLSEFSNRRHPSELLLGDVRSSEQQLFSMFDRPVPTVPLSAGPLIILATGSVLAGAVFAFLLGVGTS